MTPSNRVSPTGNKEIIAQGQFLRFVAHEYFDHFGTRKLGSALRQIEVVTVPLARLIDFVTNPPDGVPVDIKIPAIYAVLKEKNIIK